MAQTTSTPWLLETGCKALVFTLGGFLSPSWWLLAPMLQEQFSLANLLAHGLHPQSLHHISQTLRAMPADVISGQVLPTLGLCLLFSLASIWLYGKLASLMAQQIYRRMQPVRVRA